MQEEDPGGSLPTAVESKPVGPIGLSVDLRIDLSVDLRTDLSIDLRKTPRTPGDGSPPPILSESAVSTDGVARPVAVSAEVAVFLKRHEKSGYGLDVADDLTVTGVRAGAAGKVEVGWRVLSVDSTRVSSKRQLAATLHAVAAGGAARCRCLHQN